MFGANLVLDGVTLEVRGGEAVALLGSNGAGKTTLLRILATLVRPTRGTAVVAGHDCVREAEAVRAAVGVVAHGVHLYEDLTALENLRFWTALHDVDAPSAALMSALAAVDLDHVAAERVRRLSAGMKRRLSLARFVLRRPRVLLLDEPFASLDQQARKWLDNHLQEFKTLGGAVVMATHSFDRGLAVADRVAILAGGRVALDMARAGLAPDEIQRLYTLYTEAAP
ncbi:MAG TPA: heme ABC exporter ATP-binding protein CcmA [Methylomirabilota bacterium]